MNVLLRLYWPLFIATMLYFAFINVFLLPGIMADSGGLKPLDVLITGYSFDTGSAFLSATQASGGTAFADFHATHDMIFPALYGVTFALAIWSLDYGWSKTVRIILSSVPLAAAAIDYVENAEIIALINMNAPDITIRMIHNTSVLTETKYTLIGITLCIIVVILARNFIANSLPVAKPKEVK